MVYASIDRTSSSALGHDGAHIDALHLSIKHFPRDTMKNSLLLWITFISPKNLRTEREADGELQNIVLM